MVTFEMSIKQADHMRRFVVTRTDDHGWDVHEELDAHVVSSVHYADWQRVERARLRFETAGEHADLADVRS